MKKKSIETLKNNSFLGTLKTNGKTMGILPSITPWERTKKRSASIGSKSYTALLAATLLIHGQEALYGTYRLVDTLPSGYVTETSTNSVLYGVSETEALFYCVRRYVDGSQFRCLSISHDVVEGGKGVVVNIPNASPIYFVNRAPTSFSMHSNGYSTYKTDWNISIPSNSTTINETTTTLTELTYQMIKSMTWGSTWLQQLRISDAEYNSLDATRKLCWMDTNLLKTGTINSIPGTDKLIPTLTGSAAAGALVDIYDDTIKLATVNTTSTQWTYKPTTLSQGTHSFIAKAHDGNGNYASPSSTITFIYDSVAPAAPIVNFSFQLASLNIPTVISGTAEAGSTVAIYLQDSTTAIGSAHTDDIGRWSIMLPNSMLLDDGVQPIYTKITDAIGNTSTPYQASPFPKAITAASMATALLNNDAFITKIAQDLSTTIVNNVGGNVTFVNSLEGIFKNDANTINTLLDGLAANAVTYAALYNALLSRGSAVNNLKAAFDDGVTSSSSPNANYDTIMTAIQSKINEAQ